MLPRLENQIQRSKMFIWLQKLTLAETSVQKSGNIVLKFREKSFFFESKTISPQKRRLES